MDVNTWWLLAVGSSSPTLLSGRAVGIAIWIGLAILSIALMVLMRTRWGQAQPLSKCVALSIFAHFLLFMYAYGTHLLSPGPQGIGDEPIRLTLVAPEDPAADEPATENSQPWQRFAPEEPIQPDTDQAERRAVEPAEVPRTREPGNWHAGTDAIPEAVIPMDEPVRPDVKPPSAKPLAPSRSVVKAAAIEEPVPPTRAPEAPTIPDPVGPARMPIAPTPAPAPARVADARLPSELADIGSRMQQLADVPARSETADILPGSVDQLVRSENRGSASFEGSGVPPDAAAGGRAGENQLVAIPPLMRRASAAAGPVAISQLVARAPRRLGDGQTMPGPYRLRNLPQREQIAVELGGNARAAAAVEAALAWLASQQERDGRWDADRWGGGMELKNAGHDRGGAGTNADTGITGLALLAFLANGQTHLEGKYRKNIQHGLEFLLRSQTADGNMAGNAKLYASMYCHGMASLALSEALAVTGDTRIRPFVQRAVEYSIRAQHPTTGGWRYQPGDPGDMSQFGWQVMALKSAAMAGITVPQRTREGMLHFLQRCEQGRHGGLSGYRPGTPASRPMSAEALVCRYFLDLSPGEPLVGEATQFIMGELPQPGTPNLYYWYYGTLAMFQVQGEPWSRWNAALQRQLIPLQRTDGHLAGSWNADSVWGNYGGRVYSTAMATLCLEVYYRYLPVNVLQEPPRVADAAKDLP